jgi:transcriptional regulator with XRE-family HTH domain
VPRDTQLAPPLGQRLRALRQRWPGLTVRQRDIAVAFGSMVDGKLVPLSLTAVSGWETGRETPTAERLQSYARFFASPRTMQDDETVRLLPDEELSDEEQGALKTLETELLSLRERQINPPVISSPVPPESAAIAAPSAPTQPVWPAEEPVAVESERFWRFPDGQPIFIVCSKVLDPTLLNHPYANPLHPNYMPLMLFADGLAVVELFGHLRAENPGSDVRFKTHDEIDADDLSGHVVIIGGGDVNPYFEWFSDRMDVPISGAAIGPDNDDDTTPTDEAAFTVYERDSTGKNKVLATHRPIIKGTVPVSLVRSDGSVSEEEWPNLVYDLALLARQPNPLNTTATATLCHGLYGNGTYGIVRAFTDARLRDANERYRRERFGDSEEFYMVVRVPCNQKLGVTTTPDLNRKFNRALEWPE